MSEERSPYDGVVMSALADRVQALEASVEDLLAGSAGLTTLEAIEPAPELRVRISHAHTLKDGWRCDSTTVEWTGRGPVDWAAIEDAGSQAYDTGRAEARERNAAEAAS